jgi:hypothetical protein
MAQAGGVPRANRFRVLAWELSLPPQKGRSSPAVQPAMERSSRCSSSEVLLFALLFLCFFQILTDLVEIQS